VSEATIAERDPASAGLGAWAKSPLFWLTLIVVGLVVYVYEPLFLPPVDSALSAESEQFFFEASQSNGLPALVLAAWLFYRRSHYLDLLAGRGALAGGAFLLALTIALYAWATFTDAPDQKLVSSVLLLAGAALLLGGCAALRAFWLPILFLLFALPIPPVVLGAVIYPVQLATATFAGGLLNAIGVDSLVNGDQILRPENTFIVIESCSGLKTLVTLSMLTVLLIDLFERRGLHAAILVVLTPFVAFLTNGLRVVTLVLNPHSSIHSVHNLQGIAMLLVGLMGIYLLDGLIERLLGTRDPSAEDGDYGLALAAPAPVRSRALRLAAIAALLLAIVAVEHALPRWPVERGLAELPDALLARVFGEDATRKLAPDYQFNGSVRYLAHARRLVDVDGMPVDVHLGVADEQERRFTALSPRLAWPDSGYATVSKADVELEPGGPSVRRMVLRHGARAVVSYSWFERRGSFWREWWRQAAALDRSPFARPDHILAIRLATPLERIDAAAEAAADARVRQIWARLAPELAGYAPNHAPNRVPPQPGPAPAA